MAFFTGQNESEPVTALFDEDGEQLFPTVGLLSVAVSPSNTFSQHTLENGTVTSDNKIKNQNRITVQAVLDPDDYVEVYQKIKSADDNDTIFTIQTRVDTYDNMYIESRPYEESGKMSNTMAVTLNFIEQQFTGVKTGKLPATKVKNVADQDVQNSGTKLPGDDSSTLYNWIFG